MVQLGEDGLKCIMVMAAHSDMVICMDARGGAVATTRSYPECCLTSDGRNLCMTSSIPPSPFPALVGGFFGCVQEESLLIPGPFLSGMFCVHHLVTG
jgi:hypothetical protein